MASQSSRQVYPTTTGIAMTGSRNAATKNLFPFILPDRTWASPKPSIISIPTPTMTIRAVPT